MMQNIKRDCWDFLTNHAQSNHYLLHQSEIQKQQWFASTCQITLNYSHQSINQETLKLLINLANACGLKEKIQRLMRGDKVNFSENRPALHTALRAPDNHAIWVNNINIMHQVMHARNNMKCIVQKIRHNEWLGFSGKPITDIVNIGIGGSDLGPRFCLKAFAAILSKDRRYHFISDVDPSSFEQTIQALNPETTLFIVASKSFSTQETIYNAHKAIQWLGNKAHLATNCIAVTAHIEKAQQFGITTILPIWEWVGGRFSLCSAINLITAIAIGMEAFNQLLAGAHAMDNHFQNTAFDNNLPVLYGLLGIWNNNFLNRHNLLILTYAQQLEQWVSYVQQLDMESNGKAIDNQGHRVNYATGPVIWGGLGNQAQHSYYQLLCQGTHKVTADFITLDSLDGELINDMCASKINVLTNGVHDEKNPVHEIPGNLPLNHIRLKDAAPFTIGALVALYEHKVFTQSVIWDINPFDQPGVESAKRFKAKLDQTVSSV